MTLCSVIPLSAYSSHQKRNPFVSQGIPFPRQFGPGAWGGYVSNLQKLWELLELFQALLGGFTALKSMARKGYILLICNSLKYKFAIHTHTLYICTH